MKMASAITSKDDQAGGHQHMNMAGGHRKTSGYQNERHFARLRRAAAAAGARIDILYRACAGTHFSAKIAIIWRRFALSMDILFQRHPAGMFRTRRFNGQNKDGLAKRARSLPRLARSAKSDAGAARKKHIAAHRAAAARKISRAIKTLAAKLVAHQRARRKMLRRGGGRRRLAHRVWRKNSLDRPW